MHHAGDKIWKEAARFFAEVSQMFEELVTYEVRDDQEIEHCTSVLSASGLKVQSADACGSILAIVCMWFSNIILRSF